MTAPYAAPCDRCKLSHVRYTVGRLTFATCRGLPIIVARRARTEALPGESVRDQMARELAAAPG